MCTHPVEKVRFLHVSCADRKPCWVCDLCDAKFDKDPNNPNSVRYLDEPNPVHNKKFPLVFPKQNS